VKKLLQVDKQFFPGVLQFEEVTQLVRQLLERGSIDWIRMPTRRHYVIESMVTVHRLLHPISRVEDFYQLFGANRRIRSRTESHDFVQKYSKGPSGGDSEKQLDQ
jgi:hypothetical protein